LFSWADVWQEALVLDLFAGSGALGIEALSRGARNVVIVERSPVVVKGLIANLTMLDLLGQSEVRRGEAGAALGRLEREGRRFDVALLDPPYDSEILEVVLPLLANGEALQESGTVLVERSRHRPLPEVAGLRILETRRYGDTIIDALERVSVE
jgi:16S rRNA (guanine(966)-N(2))-methyltransferase RsmD